MPITRVRIIDPQYQFEDQSGYIDQVFPDHSLEFGVFFPEAMISKRYSLDDLEVDGFISNAEFSDLVLELTEVRHDNLLNLAIPQNVEVTPVFEIMAELLDLPENQDFLEQENDPIQENTPELEPALVVVDTPIPDIRTWRQLTLDMPEVPNEPVADDLHTLLEQVPRGSGIGIIRKPGSRHFGWMCWWDMPPGLPRRPSRPGLLYRVNLLLQNGQVLDADDGGMRSYYEDNIEVVAPMGEMAA